MALTEKAHELITAHFDTITKPLKLAIDATCGNGHDTLFLAKLGFESVAGFDIQAKAISTTSERLHLAGFTDITLIQTGHEHISKHIKQEIDCVMFNLGYLPSADKNVTTKVTTTLLALDICLNKLSENGLISLMCYPGHPAGKEESESIQQWLKSLNNTWQVSTHKASSPTPQAPILYSIKKQNHI